MSDDNFDPWVSNVAGKGAGRYLPSAGNTKDYTKGIENTLYYQQFGSSLIDENGNLTDVGQAWANLQMHIFQVILQHPSMMQKVILGRLGQLIIMIFTEESRRTLTSQQTILIMLEMIRYQVQDIMYS